MKKQIFIIAAITVFLISNVCSAMILSQPVQIGSISISESEYGELLDGYILNGQTSNTWQEKGHFDKNSYKRGIASWGNAPDQLYVHYSCQIIPKSGMAHYTLYGGIDPSNTVRILPHKNKIFILNNSDNITMYVIDSDIALPSDKNYTLLGKRQDGRFVKYFDVNTILKQYYGEMRVTLDEYNKNPHLGVTYFIKNILVKNDTLIFPYYKYYWMDRNNHILVGEIRCKWDESAQWFSVENVVY